MQHNSYWLPSSLTHCCCTRWGNKKFICRGDCQRDCAMLRVIKYFTKSLKITQDHSCI